MSKNSSLVATIWCPYIARPRKLFQFDQRFPDHREAWLSGGDKNIRTLQIRLGANSGKMYNMLWFYLKISYTGHNCLNHTKRVLARSIYHNMFFFVILHGLALFLTISSIDWFLWLTTIFFFFSFCLWQSDIWTSKGIFALN